MWVVKYKNNLTVTGQGDGWVIDGAGLNWTKAQAEAHVARCEFKEHSIPYQVVEDSPEEIEMKHPRKRGEEKSGGSTAS